MVTFFILILLIIAIFLAISRHIKACISTLIFALVCFFAIGNGLVPLILLKQLQTPFVDLPKPEWKSQNAIVLLGAGAIKLPTTNAIKPTIMAYSRIHETARLYLECAKDHHQCTIIISGGDALKIGKSEAIVYRDALLSLGINNSDIELETNSMNTYKNAEFTSNILKKNQYSQVILVTSGIHLKRALLYFSNFGINAKPALADYLTPQFAVIPLGYNFAVTDFAIHEYLGIARFYFYNFLGWNKNVSVSGEP
jgi:uncharacterized SAM-binding protein YcdF (DUF218 family)